MGTVAIDNLADHPDLVPVIADWLCAQWGEWAGRPSVQDWIPRIQRRLNRDRIPLTLVAMSGDVPVGTAALVECDLPTRPQLYPWIAAVYVVPETRGRGIGTALIRQLLKECQRLKVEELYVFNSRERNLYTKLGWAVIEVSEYRGETIHIMKRDVDA